MELLILSSIALAATVLGLFNLRLDHLSKKHDDTTESLSIIRQHDRLLIKADIDIAQRLRTLERNLQSVQDCQDKLESTVSQESGYQQAIKMFEMGATVKDVVQTCHLARAEAELLQNIYG